MILCLDFLFFFKYFNSFYGGWVNPMSLVESPTIDKGKQDFEKRRGGEGRH